jgi:maleate cis-trans isomerase
MIKPCLIALSTILLMQSAFADETANTIAAKQCEAIARACVSAGYVEKNSTDKEFWQDCMKPVLMGQTVKGVNSTSAQAAGCKALKIQNMENELQEFKQAPPAHP